MSITFSSGGFDGTMRSDSSGNIFIETTGNTKTITIGGIQQITGSEVRELDKSTGNVIFKKRRDAAGKVTETKFDKTSGKVLEEKIKDPGTGKESIRSGSSGTESGSSENQIEFLQKDGEALIIVSGGNPGFTAFMNNVGDRAIRARGDVYASGSNICSTGVAMNGGPFDYYIASQHVGALGSPQQFGIDQGNGWLMVSQSGDTRVSKNLIVDGGITATSLNVTSITSSIVTSSILQTEGSNIFGDAITDTQTFNGHITASGKISASGVVTASSYHTINKVNVTDFTNLNVADSSNQTGINLTLSTGNGRLSGVTSGLTTTSDVQFNDITAGGNISSSGYLSTQGAITASGNISSSGNIQAASYSNMLDVKHFAYYISTTSNGDVKYFIPLNSLTENSTGNPFNRFFAPYDGVFKKVIFNARDNNPGNTTVSFHTGSANFNPANAVQSITIGSAVDDTSYEVNFSSSICKINKGDHYSVAIQGTNEVQNYWHGTWVIEYDTST